MAKLGLKGVLFDFNGVIVDDYPLQKKAWGKMSWKLRGRTVTDDEMVKKIRGVRTIDTIAWMAKNKLKKSEVESFVKVKDKIIQELYQSSPLFRLNKGLKRFLNELKQSNISKTIATSSNLESMQFSFEKLGLSAWFDIEKVVYNDGKHKGKPAPDAYLLAASKIKLPPELCVVFEDALNGIQSANAAGVGAIVAVGSDERLSVLTKSPGVIRGIHDFDEINVKDIIDIEG